MIIIVMGVCGCGKTTVGRLIAKELGAIYVEGDQFHNSRSIDKMSRGIPLDDDDRWPWLESLRSALGEWDAEGTDVVLACSALKQAYREVLLDQAGDTYFVFLRGDEALISARMAQREHHYMPSSLIPSQFAALEEPVPGPKLPEDHLLVADIREPPSEIAARVLAHVRKEPAV